MQDERVEAAVHVVGTGPCRDNDLCALTDGDFLLTGTPVSQIQMSVAGPISGFVVVFVPLQR